MALMMGNYLFHSEAMLNKNGEDCKLFHSRLNRPADFADSLSLDTIHSRLSYTCKDTALPCLYCLKNPLQ